MGMVMIRGWDVTFPGHGGTSMFDPGATIAARWLHELNLIS